MDFNKMMGSIKEMQEKMKTAQEELEKIEVTGESGAGMVKVTANGKKRIINVEIDPSVINRDDQDMLQDLVVAATNKALEEAEIQAKEELKKSTSGMLPNIPGLDLSNLM